nr:MAG TPA: hypothetical protein [Caudoviricetes sp.]
MFSANSFIAVSVWPAIFLTVPKAYAYFSRVFSPLYIFSSRLFSSFPISLAC